MCLHMRLCSFVCFCFVLRERKNMKYGGKEEDMGEVGGREKNMNKIYCKNLKRELTICYCCFPLVILRFSLDIVLTI